MKKENNEISSLGSGDIENATERSLDDLDEVAGGVGGACVVFIDCGSLDCGYNSKPPSN